jgi:hypothetical protein
VIVIYLSIPGGVLHSMRLSSDEKILISYVYMWQRQERPCRRRIEYIAFELGIANIEEIIIALVRKGIIVETSEELQLAQIAYTKITAAKEKI